MLCRYAIAVDIMQLITFEKREKNDSFAKDLIRYTGGREREMLPTPYLLILGGMSSGIQAIWPPRVAVLFQFGRALLRNQRALSGKPMFWQPYRCTTPGCWPRGIAGVMDLLSAGGTT